MSFGPKLLFFGHHITIRTDILTISVANRWLENWPNLASPKSHCRRLLFLFHIKARPLPPCLSLASHLHPWGEYRPWSSLSLLLLSSWLSNMSLVTKVVFPIPPPTTNNLSSHQRTQLLRKAKKLEQIFGVTPRLLDNTLEPRGELNIQFYSFSPLTIVRRADSYCIPKTTFATYTN